MCRCDSDEAPRLLAPRHTLCRREPRQPIKQEVRASGAWVVSNTPRWLLPDHRLQPDRSTLLVWVPQQQQQQQAEEEEEARQMGQEDGQHEEEDRRVDRGLPGSGDSTGGGVIARGAEHAVQQCTCRHLRPNLQLPATNHLQGGAVLPCTIQSTDTDCWVLRRVLAVRVLIRTKLGHIKEPWSVKPQEEQTWKTPLVAQGAGVAVKVMTRLQDTRHNQ